MSLSDKTARELATKAAIAPRVSAVRAAAYRIPTEEPESDGTLEWDSTTMVVTWVSAAGDTGVGYTYAHQSAVGLIQDLLAPAIRNQSALDTNKLWLDCRAAVRNQGHSGLTACAVAAVDLALWDLKGRLLESSVLALLGSAREQVEVYGSGGITSMSDQQLEAQAATWAAMDLSKVKIKVGREPQKDLPRASLVHSALPDVDLMVDANGAYTRQQALRMATGFGELGVTWFEEPVVMSDREGLRLLRDHSPPGLRIASGEYGYVLREFRDLLQSGAVDVLQADVTRCQARITTIPTRSRPTSHIPRKRALSRGPHSAVLGWATVASTRAASCAPATR